MRKFSIKNLSFKNVAICALVASNIFTAIYTGLDVKHTKAQLAQAQKRLEQVQSENATLYRTIDKANSVIRSHEETLHSVVTERDNLKEKLSSRGSGRVITVEVTKYTHTGNVCANGNYPKAGRTVACNFLPLGSKVRIDGNVYTVEDTGGMGNNVIDIFDDSYASCVDFGRQVKEVEIL